MRRDSYRANRISRKILLHVGRGIFRVKSFAADSVIVKDASRRIGTAATWHRVRKIACVRHKTSCPPPPPVKFVSDPLCRVRRCVCTHQVHSGHHDDTCFNSHIKHSRREKLFGAYRYRFILLLGIWVLLGFTRHHPDIDVTFTLL